MKRFNENLEVCVYKYDLMPPLDWGADVDEELKKQVDLWNQLCVIEREHIAAVRAVAEPSATADAEAKPLVERVEQLIAKRRAIRKAAKKKLPTPELDAEINELLAKVKELRAVAKTQRTTAYANNKDQLKALDKERYTRVKTAYQNSGLFWSNYNAIVASYDRARGLALKKGRELHERRWNGEGRLTNQIQGGMTTGRLLANTHSQAGLGPKPEKLRASHHAKKGKQGYTLKINVFTRRDPVTGTLTRRTVSFPLILYRPLPEDALIKEVVVTRRRFADKFAYAVVFTMTRAKPERPEPRGMPVAINLGWRKVGEDALRVATAVTFSGQSARGFTEPSHTEISGTLLRGFETYEEVQGERDNARNQIIEKVRAYQLDLNDPTNIQEPIREAWQQVASNERVKTGTLIYLYKLLQAYPNVLSDLRAELSTWFHGHEVSASLHNDPRWRARLYLTSERVRLLGENRINREQANRRRWLNDARLYYYRAEARRLVGDASLVIINEHDMAQTARVTTDLPPPARRQRFIAAPSVLRQTVIDYCRKHNIEVRMFKGGGKVHWQCGNEYHPALPNELKQLCTHCHVYFDVDENFCLLMLRQTAIPPQARAA